jgi:hypothetical protein
MGSNLSVLLALLIYLLALWLAMRWRNHAIKSPWLRLLRGFFPSWHFFDRLGHQPVLQTRAIIPGESWTLWQRFHPSAKRSLRGAFFQPQVCSQLYQQSLIEQLAVELTESTQSDSNLLGSSVYLSVQALATSLVSKQWPGASRMQFRLLLIDPLRTEDDPPDQLGLDLEPDDERLMLLSESLSLCPSQD